MTAFLKEPEEKKVPKLADANLLTQWMTCMPQLVSFGTTLSTCPMPNAYRFLRRLIQTCAFAAAASLAVSTSAFAGTSTDSGIWPPGQITTKVPNIPTPANTQQSTFTGYTGGGPYHYKLYTFTVDATGTYTATSTTTNVVNTTWFLNGTFSPDPVAPTTPLGNFIAGVLANGPVPVTGNFTGVSLVAGQPYTMLVAFNIGSTSGDLSSVSITGPGCINLGATVCAVAAPTLSETGRIGMAALLGLAGLYAISRKKRDGGRPTA